MGELAASPPHGGASELGGSAIEGRGITKSYRQGTAEVPVLQGVDVSVSPGEFVVLLGPSGSGKSTLLHILGLMDSPGAGSVSLLGADVSGLGERERSVLRCRKLGFVFQFDSLLPEFTVLENVLMPARIAGTLDAGGRARELLGRFGLEGLSGRLPAELSGGERQRACVARALVNRPAVLLADEPTGNLDRRNGELVFCQLKEAAEGLGVAVLMVTHNEAAARFASRALHLEDGRITGD